ncbi:MAG: hypothetical protein IJ801_09080 [Lachnospiraceae bacterium]|nr:hypothetical protein [Lachnospiraceae bacterium]
MDENYLDSLLNEFSLDKEIDHKIEDELDSQIQEEKRKRQQAQENTREDLFNMDLERDANSLTDEKDLLFSEEQMDELDQLDQFADMDMGDLDFSDIDFNDLDMTKLDGLEETDSLDDLLKEFEGDLQIDGFFDEEEKGTSTGEAEQVQEKALPSDNAEVLKELAEPAAYEEPISTEEANLNEDSFDADSFLDGLLAEEDEEAAAKQPVVEIAEQQPETGMDSADHKESEVDSLIQDLDMQIGGGLDDMDGFADFGKVQEEKADEQSDFPEEMTEQENNDLEDLFSMLDMEGSLNTEGDSGAVNESVESGKADASVNTEESLEQMTDLDSFEEKPEKKKRTLTQIFFGDPEEDDILSEEELAANEAKKAAKKAKKEAAKQAKKEKAEQAKQEKQQKNSAKKQASEDKKKLRAQKKAQKREEERANAEPEKPLNKVAVAFIFSLFLGGTILFYLATYNFNYTQAIENATHYFANRKYKNAYDEIVGVEVKDKDEELKNRIYTVMYVERLYEAYENNLELGRAEKALDSLLRGVDKYYEHYEEAQQLGIAEDLDYAFEQIRQALLERYGISIEQALEINAMENYQYVEVVNDYIAQAKDVPEGNE